MTNEKLLIKHGWLRVLLFTICFLAVAILANIVADSLLIKLGNDKSAAEVSQSGVDFRLWVQLCLSFFTAWLTVFCFRTFLDKQTVLSLGLETRGNLVHGAAGLVTAIIILGVGTLTLVALRNLQWTDIHFNGFQISTGVVLMLLVSFSEELVFRGYILNNLMASTNKWLALAISALLFAVLHLNNPGITVMAALNIFVAGLLLGINYIYTRNLWFGILFHFMWNFYQGPVLGYKVSGVELGSVLEQQLSGHPLITGGPFGFEGSVLNLVLSIVAILLLGWVYKKRHSDVGFRLSK